MATTVVNELPPSEFCKTRVSFESLSPMSPNTNINEPLQPMKAIAFKDDAAAISLVESGSPVIDPALTGTEHEL